MWRKQVTAFEKQNLVPIVKHGGGDAMISGCMAASAICRWTFIDFTLDHMGYFEYIRRKFEAERTRFENWKWLLISTRYFSETHCLQGKALVVV